MSDDAVYMREALELARLGYGTTLPNPMVGAVAVRDGEIVGRGFHRQAGGPHAEVFALREAGERAAGATMYVTLEPCSTQGRTPACTGALIRSGVRRVVAAVADPNPKHAGRGFEVLRQAGIEVVSGVLEEEARELNKVFFRFITAKRPYVLLKMAETLDGRIAADCGDSFYVTGPEARSRVQELRRGAAAVMIGGETLRRDRARLTVREPADWPRQPLRLIASQSMTLEALATYYPEGGAELVRFGTDGAWDELLFSLGARQISSLLIEGGGRLAAMALAAGAVDEVEFHIAPKLLLGGRPVVSGVSPLRMSDALQLENIQVKRYGVDTAISGRVVRKGA